MLVTERDIAQIVGIGLQKHPHEACGLLITGAEGLARISEVPNRAPDPSKDVVMTADDIEEALRRMVGDPARYPGNLARELVVWHTHPGGLVGPSKVDMEFRRQLGNTRCLVVSLPNGEAVQF